ncbi:serpin family protein [bacterium]|nr:serpin family protein [bacterium]
MKSTIYTIVLLLIMLVISNCTRNNQEKIAMNPEYLQEFEEGEVNSISDANNKLSLVLFKLLDQEDKNLVFSSFSISNALAMAAETTNEEISQVIRKGLRLPKDINSIREGYQTILKSYEVENEYYALNLANALWIEEKYPLEEIRKETIEKFYLGKALTFDNNQPGITANRVNEWCNAKTQGMIDKIISGDDINANTHLLLTNAIYFKGSWQEEFSKKTTKEKIFHNSKMEQKQVDFMSQRANLAYTETEEAQILKLNYQGGDLSMLLILPRDNNLSDLKDKLSSEMIENWKKKLKTYDVYVELPKFKFDFDAEMSQPLKQLGMQRAFTAKSANELIIGTVKHKAIIDVNEEGTEAAAATVVAMVTRSMPIQYEKREFIADHPFIFLIQDDLNQNILFMGKVENPVYGD